MLRYPVVCRADAGLWVLLATMQIPIVLLTKEWSTSFGVNLTEARLLSGLENDLFHALDQDPREVVKYLENLSK